MNKDTRDMDTIKNKIITTRQKIYALEEELSIIQSKILENIFSLDVFKYINEASKLSSEKSRIQTEFLAYEAILFRASFFDNEELMLFFSKLISAFEGTEYECTAAYLPSYENQKTELNYVISKKSTNYGLLENVQGITKLQDESDYTSPLVMRASADIANRSDYILENKTAISWKFPYLIDAIDALISYRIRHPKVSQKGAIDNVLSRYIPKFQNLPQEDKTKIMKLAL